MMTLNSKALVPAAAFVAFFACSQEVTSPPPVSAAGSAGSAVAGASMTTPTGGANSVQGGAASTPTAGTSGSVGGAGASGASAAGTGGAVIGGGGGGGTDASSGAGTGGASGSSSGSGGSGPTDGWVNIFNGTDLTGWVPLIHKLKFNEDPNHTFRVDPATSVIRVTYEDYPGQSFDDHCGLLYYDKALTDYRVRVTYRFREPQAKNPVSWGKNNSGLMVFATDPRTVTGDPEFPPLIEIQLLGTPSAGGTKNGNLCQPGGITVSKLFGQALSDSSCHDSKSGAAKAADQWVTVEAEVHVTGDTNVYQSPEMTTPVLTFSGPMYKGQPVTSGYLALQSESQPVEFKDIQLKELK